jgi:two-component system, cell cycle sensor histidine kinase and response regulator CckA
MSDANAERIAELEAEVKRLRARDEELSDFIENAAVALHWVAADGKILWANQAELDLLGYTREEYVGHHIAEFHADGRAIADIMRALSVGETLRDYEAPVRHKDGRLLEVAITSSARREGDRFVHTRCFTRDITASKMAQRELREAHGMLGALLHSSPLPVVALTAAGNITLWNAAAERVFGWEAAEVLGRPLPFIPQDKVAEHRDMRARDLRGEGFSEREIRRMRKDGTPLDLLVSTDHVRDPATGTVRAIISVYLDITDRKRAHEELKQTRDRLLFALDAAGMVAWERSPDGAAVTRSGNLYAQLGVPADGRPEEFMRLIHPDDRDRVRHTVERAHETGAELDVEFRLQLPDGSIRWMIDRGRVFRDAGGGRFSGVMLDITARKLAEEALRETEQRLQDVLDNSTTVVYVKDLEGRYLLVNRRFEELFRVEHGHAIGKTDYDVFLPERAETYRHNDSIVLARGAAVEFEEVAALADGNHTYLSVKFPMRNAHGQIYGVCGISTDITERQRLEAKLRESAKLESLGVLAGGVAHDFNNLLVGILGNASMLQQDVPDSSPTWEVLNSIVQAGERAAQLTRQMLAYAGRGQFLIAPVDLSNQVRDIAKLTRAAVPRNVDFRLTLPPDLPPVDADAGQLQQLVMNLIVNAGEAIDQGSGSVEITTGVENWSEAALQKLAAGTLAPGRLVVLRVRDTGCGMDRATLDRIFDPFFTTKFTGRGLGLAAALGILRAHHAGIHVETRPGAGSTFTVLFPPAAQAAHAPRVAVSAAGPLAGRILVVDDEPAVRQMAQAALERHGFSVAAVEHGQAALNWLQDHDAAVDLLLLDLAMPVLAGDATLAEVRSRFRDILVVCSSGYSEQEARERFGPGAVAFLQKPYTAAQLTDAMARALKARRPISKTMGHE